MITRSHVIDLTALASVAASLQASATMQGAVEGVARSAAVRFFDAPFVLFDWRGAPAFLTPTDAIAFAGVMVLLVRFVAWAVEPLARALWSRLFSRR